MRRSVLVLPVLLGLSLTAAGAAVPTAASGAEPASGCAASSRIVNGGFETPQVDGYGFVDQSGVDGWRTTEGDGVIEVWHEGWDDVPADSGTQFAELNANEASTLYQDVPTTPGASIGWSLAHRGRSGADTMRVLIGPVDGPLEQNGPDLTDDNDAWGAHSGRYEVPAGQTVTRFAFEAVSSFEGNPSYGNFLDSIVFGSGPCLTMSKTASDLTRPDADARIGDTLHYVVTLRNDGGLSALRTRLLDPLPAALDYVPGSLTVSAGGSPVAVTDQTGDDLGEYDAAGRTVTVRLGEGADAQDGGSLGAGDSIAVAFDAVIARAPEGGSITNTASAVFGSQLDSAVSTTPTTATTTLATLPLASASTSATPAPVAVQRQLASTGVDPAPIALLVLGLLALGAGFLGVARRKH